RDFPVLNASAGGGKIIYEQAGLLHLLDPESGTSTRLSFGLAADLPDLRERYVKGARWIRNASLSPSGARAVLEFRGEIVTVPAEKGDPRNITLTPGVHERSPVWSPDGKTVAYVSDASGEYALHVRSQDGRGEVRKLKLEGSGFYDSFVWSPDGKKIAYADNSWSLFFLDLETGAVTKIGSDHQLGPSRARTIHSAWSPDSKWIVYTLSTQTYIQKVFLYSLERNRSFPVTDGLSEVAEPVFDAGGKYLYFLASTDAGPVKQWFDQSSADMRMTSSIYVLTLRKGIPSPLARESDEEAAAAPEKAPAQDKAKEAPKKPAEPFAIDIEGLELRIQALPLPAGSYRSLQPGEEGQLYYLESPAAAGAGPFGAPPGATLHRFSFKDRKSEVQIPEVSGYLLSGDKKKILYFLRDSWFIVASGAKPQPGQGKLNIEAVEVRIEPRSEWEQIFHEAWRINRDYFYAANMHGADWKAMRGKYAVFLPHLACRGDLNRLIQWMCSELAVGHHRVGGGDSAAQPKTVPGGLLGADFAVENGRFRFKKVYGGLNWNPELRSPLTEPGVDVKAGEYLLAVNGRELRFPENVYSLFENTAGKIVEITVGPDPSGRGARTAKVVPLESESALRNRDWVEGNLRKVEEATGGRVAYVYVPNTTTQGHTYFKRYFFPQAHKEAIIVDERFNGGGLVADYYIDHLRKPVSAYWHMRYGADLKTPSASIQGPKVMLIDETAGSGGDMLPWMFRKFGLGPLIGKRTWGGLVGTLGFPVLMDGGGVTAPNLAIWTEDGWIVENEGVPPDIEVEQTPALVIAGRDPQLEKAIEVVMELLKKNPPPKPERPPYPVRVK
ncbi:MAG: peptidase S41, partial [Candidatus Aminicenantes bacterium]|nr:peptidase S41 [Candidatus Aminicenantes bacterium]